MVLGSTSFQLSDLWTLDARVGRYPLTTDTGVVTGEIVLKIENLENNAIKREKLVHRRAAYVFSLL